MSVIESSLSAARRGGRQTELAFAHHGVDPRDVMTYGAQPLVVVELTGGRLEPEVEQLLLGLLELGDQLVVLETAQLGGRCQRHQTSPTSRVTIRHFIGNLWIARVSASRAVCSFGNDSSNITRPGLTFATHHSGEP